MAAGLDQRRRLSGPRLSGSTHALEGLCPHPVAGIGAFAPCQHCAPGGDRGGHLAKPPAHQRSQRLGPRPDRHGFAVLLTGHGCHEFSGATLCPIGQLYGSAFARCCGVGSVLGGMSMCGVFVGKGLPLQFCLLISRVQQLALRWPLDAPVSDEGLNRWVRCDV
jgi:hypothetical protein